ncbi:MAG: FKBP-type peptidyl-prolyl cis-trans isomerase [Spirochaetota bacterium]
MINNGQFALVHYTGTVTNGDVFDTTQGREPFEFEIGQGDVIPAFEDAVKSMAIDEEKEISVKAADAYGEYNEEMKQQIPFAEISQFLVPQEGLVIQVMTQEGQHVPATIFKVTDQDVTLDFNHPLAGKDLTFKLKLVGVNDEATQEEEECGCGCGCGGEGKDEECGGGCSCGGGCGN